MDIKLLRRALGANAVFSALSGTILLIWSSWLAGSILLLAAGVLNREGNWVLLVVGDIVLALTILQVIGIRRADGERPWRVI